MGQRSAAVTTAAAASPTTAAATAVTAATAEPTAETEGGTTIQLCIAIKPPKKQLPNLQEKQPYVDKWIRQRRQA